MIYNNETTKIEMDYPQNHEQSPRQAGAWRSQKERQAPAWHLDGMFFIGYHLNPCVYGFGELSLRPLRFWTLKLPRFPSGEENAGG